MKRIFAVLVVVVIMCLGVMVQAGQPNITIDTVFIGDKGNTADTTGYGKVDYNYNIGKYEVTAGQYTAFLNAKATITDTYGLYNSDMWDSLYGCKIQKTTQTGISIYSVADDYANRPVNFVSYWDSVRFANWLENGQDTGSTESGAYTINYNTGIGDGTYPTILRNEGATWALTSADEWYKAAYYSNGVYSLYANGTGTLPIAGTASNYNGAIGVTWDGSISGALEQNGTKDMMGNVLEWNESIPDPGSSLDGVPTLRGGSFFGSDYYLASSMRQFTNSQNEQGLFGFRVVSLNTPQAVPEPSTLVAACVMFTPVMLSKLRSRRRK